MAELELWKEVKDSNDIHYYEAYLKRYPDGAFADIARLKLAPLLEVQRKKEEAECAEVKDTHFSDHLSPSCYTSAMTRPAPNLFP